MRFYTRMAKSFASYFLLQIGEMFSVNLIKWAKSRIKPMIKWLDINKTCHFIILVVSNTL
jgi:hypothetical protein